MDTFANWRIIFWVQTAMAGFGLVLSLLFVSSMKDGPKMIHSTKKKDVGFFLEVVNMFNPWRVIRKFAYPNIFLAVSFQSSHSRAQKMLYRVLTRQCFTCGLLATFQYALITSARAIFNPRFHLSTGLVSGLFYLAPGSGFIAGSLIGGKLSDRAVKRWIKRRDGVRLPQDRLNSGLATLLCVLPVSVAIYCWTLEEEKGGMVVPIISAFFAGLGLMGSFNGLNTYTAGASSLLLDIYWPYTDTG